MGREIRHLDGLTGELETRHLDGLRAVTTGEAPTLIGHAILTNVLSSDLGGFCELVSPEAVRKALDRGPDLIALVNHDTGRVVGRVSSKTLTVAQDDRGLHFEVIPPSHEKGLVESVARGDVTGASFAFRALRDEWNERTIPPTRTLLDFEIRELSVAVPFPAYPQTYVAALRSLERHQQLSKELPMPTPIETPPVVLPDPVPPVPPIVTERATAPDGVEVRVLGRGDSFRSWIEERTKFPKEFSHLRLGDALRALVTGPRNDLEKRVLSESVDSAGGFTVPDVLMARWIDRLRAALAVVRAGAVTVPLTSDITKIARLLGDPVSAWRSENAAVQDADPSFESVTFLPRSLDVVTKASRELLEDSINAAEMIETALERSFSVEVDRVCLYGTGTAPQPRGLRTTAGLGEISLGANGGSLASYAPILDTLNELWVDNVTEVSAAIMAPRTAATIAKFVDTTGQPLARPPALADVPFLMTANIPVNETQGTSSLASTLFLGDWSAMMLGMRTDMRVEIARELFAGNYQYGYFGHLRMDMQVTHPQSFARLIGIL